MKDKRRIISNLIWATVTFLVIVCIAVSFTVLCRPIYYFDINYLDIAEKAGVSYEVCKENYDILIDYNLLISPDELEFTEEFVLSSTERIHFKEVKNIFVTMQLTAILGTALLVGKGIVQYKKGNMDYRWLKYVLPAGGAVAGVVGLMIAVDWETAFYLMHQVFFRNDYWVFQIRPGGIINILPDTFFMHCGIAIIAAAAVLSLMCTLLYKKVSKRD